MIVKKFKIISQTGLHARPATQLVSEADKYQAKISLMYDDLEIDFKSIIGVLSLGIYMGVSVEFIFDGVDEKEAYLAIKELMEKLEIGKEV